MRKASKGCGPRGITRGSWHILSDKESISKADHAERVRIEARHSATPVWRKTK